MLEFAKKYAGNHVYSQNGEEGILIAVLSRMGILRGRAVEVGGADGLYCSNTALLIRDSGWSGLFIEVDENLCQRAIENWKDNPNVRVQCASVGGGNIDRFVDDRCDVLSLDTDGADYNIFEGLEARPKIVIIEIDSGYHPDVVTLNKDGGASYRLMLELAIQKGYFLLCHTGNLVLVRDDFRHLFPEIVGDGLSNSELYFKRDWLAAKEREEVA